MTDVNAFEYLCYYDPRNPMYNMFWDQDDIPIIPRNNCSCDNCFYGRDPLALRILELEYSAPPSEGSEV